MSFLIAFVQIYKSVLKFNQLTFVSLSLAIPSLITTNIEN